MRVRVWSEYFSLFLLVMAAIAVAAAPLRAQEATPEATEESALAQEAEKPEPSEMEIAAGVVQNSLDAWRSRDFEAWISNYAPDVIVTVGSTAIFGREQLREIYRSAMRQGVPAPEIIDSGWTGSRIWVQQQEVFPDGTPGPLVYVEYTVSNQKIASVNSDMM
ncbi:MAG: nuclear transport factor 2 family protein [Pseudomonadota bacterium]